MPPSNKPRDLDECRSEANPHACRTGAGCCDRNRAREASGQGCGREAARTGGGALADGHKLTEKIGAIAPETYDAALALNTAFLNDGVIIALEAGARIEKPIHLIHGQVGKEPVATFARTLILMGAGARATVIESF